MSVVTVLKVALEIALGLTIKLFIENGRVHPDDFVNSFLFWLPGHEALPGDGLTRQVEEMLGPVEVVEVDVEIEPEPLPIAAK